MAGVPVGRLNVLVAALAGVTVGVSMRIVGVLLIAALMVLPVIAASRVATSMRATVLSSMAIGLVSVLTGLTLAYYADLAPGGAIVLCAATLFLLALANDAIRNALRRR
jgi:zinc transport system permease protein